jgi:hypothetical protein
MQASLGFNLNDDERRSRLAKEQGVTSWCSRGTAWRFGYDPTPTLAELAAQALGLATREAQQYWHERLSGWSTIRCCMSWNGYQECRTLRVPLQGRSLK